MESIGHKLNIKGKNAEKVLNTLAEKTFLTDWCYPNPKLPNRRELCDLLVVFDNYAIIWQVNELKLNKNGKYKKTAVEKNLRQLSGARRQLFDLKTTIDLENPKRGKEKFDPSQIKRIFLISAMFGKDEEFFPLVEIIRDHTVHAFTRDFTQIVLNELDTANDFIKYLIEKEEFIDKVKKLLIMDGEEDLLALYIIDGKSFQKYMKADDILIDGGAWKNLINREEYAKKKKADDISYFWDNLINRAYEGGQEYEKLARELARTNRFQRRVLSKAFCEAHVRADSMKNQNIYRRVMDFEGVTYCFLFLDDPEPRDYRKELLSEFCMIARGKYRKNKKVIGVATEVKINPISSYDFCFLKIPRWLKKYQKYVEKLQKETGILIKTTEKHFRENEYPKK